MFKKLLFSLLFVVGCLQANVLETLSQQTTFKEFIQYLEENHESVAQEADYVDIVLRLEKGIDTPDKAWIAVLKHLSSVIKSEGMHEVMQKIDAALQDSTITKLHGGFEVVIGDFEKDEEAALPVVNPVEPTTEIISE